MTAPAWNIVPDGLRIAIRLTPKSSREGFEGIEHLSDGRAVVKARVRAAPENGAANSALAGLTAAALGVPRSKTDVVAGHTARLKTMMVHGDGDALAARLADLMKDRS